MIVPRGITGGNTVTFVLSITLSMGAITVVSFCLGRRLTGIRIWSAIPLVRWLILGVFFDSWLFVFSTTLLQSSFGLNSSPRACDAGILLCLCCYLSSKVLIYMFLVEKVFIIRGSRANRWGDKLWLGNMLFMMFPYCTVITLTFVYRNSQITEDGVCTIGLKLAANIPLLIFDFFINVYLTWLFLKPLRGMWSFKNGTPTKQGRLRRVAIRTFVGSCCTLISTLANLTTLLILRGREPGWLCFVICNGDVLFSVLVLHWVTHQDDDMGSQSALTHCGECEKTHKHHNTAARSHIFSGVFGGNEQRTSDHGGTHNGFSGHVVTNCLASKHEAMDDVPLHGIMRQTEVTRTTEGLADPLSGDIDSCGSSEIDLYDKLKCSAIVYPSPAAVVAKG